MDCENTKDFCEKFNKMIERYYDSDVNKEEIQYAANFIETWKLSLASALILDFGVETIVDMGKIAERNL